MLNRNSLKSEVASLQSGVSVRMSAALKAERKRNVRPQTDRQTSDALVLQLETCIFYGPRRAEKPNGTDTSGLAASLRLVFRITHDNTR